MGRIDGVRMYERMQTKAVVDRVREVIDWGLPTSKEELEEWFALGRTPQRWIAGVTADQVEGYLLWCGEGVDTGKHGVWVSGYGEGVRRW